MFINFKDKVPEKYYFIAKLHKKCLFHTKCFVSQWIKLLYIILRSNNLVIYNVTCDKSCGKVYSHIHITVSMYNSILHPPN